MENKTDYSDDIKTIKKLMEESSRFLSLSGLSGVFTGLIAILGAAVAHFRILKSTALFSDVSSLNIDPAGAELVKYKLVIDAITVLFLALAVSYYFSYRKAKKKGLKMWTPTTKKLILNLLIPLATGAFIIIASYVNDQTKLIVPAMLIFYGLALINACKFTYNEIFYLGLAELITGLLSIVFHDSSLLLWTIGFGFLHIAYGIIMYRRYEG